MSMAYKMVAICLSSIFDCIDSICSQFKSPLTIISITAALFFVPLRALSFITPIMSILVFFSGESRRLVLFVAFYLAAFTH